MGLGCVNSNIHIHKHEMFVNKKKKDELMGLILCHRKWSLLLVKTECKNAIKAQCSVSFPFCKCIKLYI